MLPVTLSKFDNLNIKIDTEEREYISDLKKWFTAYVIGYYWMKPFQSGIWDGSICLYDKQRGTIPYGLYTDLIKFHKKYYNNIEIKIGKDVANIYRGLPVKKEYNLSLRPHDYQIDCIEAGLRFSKGIVRSATASGKSLIISYIIDILRKNNVSENALIIVPTTSLVEQFYSDMVGYGIDSNIIGRVYEKYKEFNAPIVVATWQTLMRNHKKLSLYDCMIVDECHQIRADQLRKITEKCTNATYRLGFTGTLPTDKLEMMNIKSYIGPILREYSSGELAEMGYISKCNIDVLEVKYNNSYTGDYDTIKDSVFYNQFRMNLIKYIVSTADSNILVLVGKVEKEGEILKTFLSEYKDIHKKEIVFLSGKDDVSVREYWRKECERRKDIILIATYGIFQLGINIPSLKYVLFASPFKSKIRVLQSIGRALRKHVDKIDGAKIYDIVDDVKYLDDHGSRRIRYYESENFTIKEFILNEGNLSGFVFMN